MSRTGALGKQVDLAAAVKSIPHGALVGLGGNTLNRAPMEAVMELARQGKQGLRLVKTAGGMDVDLLCFAGCVQSVDAGFVSYETQYGLCRHYRRAVEEGHVQANEHACYTVISALRAASCGIPFMPVRGLQATALVHVNPYFAPVKDPFTGEELQAVKALRPQVSILHVHLADRQGNGFIEGPQYEDVLLSRASERVILTAERMVEDGYFSAAQTKAHIPHFMVSAVVHVPRGAAPGACYPDYGVSDDGIRSFLGLNTREELDGWLARRAYG